MNYKKKKNRKASLLRLFMSVPQRDVNNINVAIKFGKHNAFLENFIFTDNVRTLCLSCNHLICCEYCNLIG